MKKKVIISIIALIVIASAVVIIPIFLKKDLKDSLAEILNADRNVLTLNLPPAPSRYPGTIILPIGKSSAVYSFGSKDHPNMQIGKSFETEAIVKNDIQITGGLSGDLLSGVFKNQQHFELKVNITNGQILELSIQDLEELIRDNTQIKNAIDNNKKPVVLQRAYEGIISYDIKALDSQGQEILLEVIKEGERLKNRLPNVSFEGTQSNTKEVEFKINEPIVIAFEAMEVELIAQNLGEDYSVALSKINNDAIIDLGTKNLPSVEVNEDGPVAGNPNESEVRWGLITIGVPTYQNLASLNVPEVEASIKAVKEVLGVYDPVFIKQVIGTKEQPLTEQAFSDWVINESMELMSEQFDYLIVYYAGHALSMPNGELAMLMSDVDKDYAEKVNDRLTQGIIDTEDGIISAKAIYDHLGMTLKPFTLILDACYPNDEMQAALNRVNMELADQDGSLLNYVGSEFLITDELSQIGDVLWDIGNRFNYRTNDDPVIFSSKPGAKSEFLRNPNSYFSPRLAPLAARISGYKNLTMLDNTFSLSELISSLPDFKSGLGEVSLGGSITWSNLEFMQQNLRNIRP